VNPEKEKRINRIGIANFLRSSRWKVRGIRSSTYLRAAKKQSQPEIREVGEHLQPPLPCSATIKVNIVQIGNEALFADLKVSTAINVLARLYIWGTGRLADTVLQGASQSSCKEHMSFP
jgi:hypothetical protein